MQSKHKVNVKDELTRRNQYEANDIDTEFAGNDSANEHLVDTPILIAKPPQFAALTEQQKHVHFSPDLLQIKHVERIDYDSTSPTNYDSRQYSGMHQNTGFASVPQPGARFSVQPTVTRAFEEQTPERSVSPPNEPIQPLMFDDQEDDEDQGTARDEEYTETNQQPINVVQAPRSDQIMAQQHHIDELHQANHECGNRIGALEFNYNTIEDKLKQFSDDKDLQIMKLSSIEGNLAEQLNSERKKSRDLERKVEECEKKITELSQVKADFTNYRTITDTKIEMLTQQIQTLLQFHVAMQHYSQPTKPSPAKPTPQEMEPTAMVTSPNPQPTHMNQNESNITEEDSLLQQPDESMIECSPVKRPPVRQVQQPQILVKKQTTTSPQQRPQPVQPVPQASHQQSSPATRAPFVTIHPNIPQPRSNSIVSPHPHPFAEKPVDHHSYNVPSADKPTHHNITIVGRNLKEHNITGIVGAGHMFSNRFQTFKV